MMNRTIATATVAMMLAAPAFAGGRIDKGAIAQRRAEKVAAAQLATEAGTATLYTDAEIDKIRNMAQVRAFLKRLVKVTEATDSKTRSRPQKSRRPSE